MQKLTKTLLTLFLILSLLLACAVPALAADPEDMENWTDEEWLVWEKEVLGYPYTGAGDINIQVNGEFITFEDAKPVLINYRTMAPYRALFEAMGAEVSWDDATKAATATFPGGLSISVILGSKDMVVTRDGAKETIAMDVAPYMDAKLGRVFVPARFIAEGAGWEVAWDEYYHLVTLNNTAALIAEIDSHFTTINKLLASEAGAADPEEAFDFMLTGDLALTLYGEKTPSTATMTGKASGAMGGSAVSMDLSLKSDLDFIEDFAAFAHQLEAYTYGMGLELPEGVSPNELQEERLAELEKWMGAFRSSNMSLILDGTEGLVYIRSSLLPLITMAGEMGMELDENTWYKLADPSFAESYGAAHGVIVQDISIGKMLVNMTSDPQQIMHAAAILEPLLGDDYLKATTSGSTTTYRSAVGVDEYLAYLEQSHVDPDTKASLGQQLAAITESGGSLLFSYEARVRDGKLIDNSCDFELAGGGPLGIVVKAESFGDKTTSEFSLSIKGKYIGKIEAEFATSMTPRTAPVPTAPPAGAKVVEIPAMEF